MDGVRIAEPHRYYKVVFNTTFILHVENQFFELWSLGVGNVIFIDYIARKRPGVFDTTCSIIYYTRVLYTTGSAGRKTTKSLLLRVRV